MDSGISSPLGFQCFKRKEKEARKVKVSIIKEPEFYKSVIRIMLPVALQQAINMGVNMMDTMMLGSFGENPAVGIQPCKSVL